jgi:hypothetical protein
MNRMIINDEFGYRSKIDDIWMVFDVSLSSLVLDGDNIVDVEVRHKKGLKLLKIQVD